METQGYSLQGVLIVLHTACFPGVTKAPDRAVLFCALHTACLLSVTKAPDRAVLFCAMASSSAASADFQQSFHYVLIRFLSGTS